MLYVQQQLSVIMRLGMQNHHWINGNLAPVLLA